MNQETGVMGKAEPTETLMKFRSDNVLMPDKKPRGKVSYISSSLVFRRDLLD